ncbi:MAG: hypothetical protein ACRD68_13565, partial [Pyrinomonadaceae bacterium]
TRTEMRGRATLYGLNSLSAGQSARLTVVNPRPLSEREIVPCIRVKLVFDVYEASMSEPARLSFVRRVEREATLEAGEAASAEFTAGRAGGYVSAAAFVIPIEDGPVQAVATLEVREAGRTQFTLPGVRKGFDPQPDPPAAG